MTYKLLITEFFFQFHNATTDYSGQVLSDYLSPALKKQNLNSNKWNIARYLYLLVDVCEVPKQFGNCLYHPYYLVSFVIILVLKKMLFI